VALQAAPAVPATVVSASASLPTSLPCPLPSSVQPSPPATPCIAQAERSSIAPDTAGGSPARPPLRSAPPGSPSLTARPPAQPLDTSAKAIVVLPNLLTTAHAGYDAFKGMGAVAFVTNVFQQKEAFAGRRVLSTKPRDPQTLMFRTIRDSTDGSASPPLIRLLAAAGVPSSWYVPCPSVCLLSSPASLLVPAPRKLTGVLQVLRCGCPSNRCISARHAVSSRERPCRPSNACDG
jgi:hypothetical protein